MGRLDTHGHIVAGPITIQPDVGTANRPEASAYVPTLTYRNATLALLGPSSVNQVALVELDATGKALTSHHALNEGANSIVSYELVRRGPEVVAAWITNGRNSGDTTLSLARIAR